MGVVSSVVMASGGGSGGKKKKAKGATLGQAHSPAWSLQGAWMVEVEEKEYGKRCGKGGEREQGTLSPNGTLFFFFFFGIKFI